MLDVVPAGRNDWLPNRRTHGGLGVDRRVVVAVEVEGVRGRRRRREHSGAEVERLRRRRRRSEHPGARDGRVHDDAVALLGDATDFLLELGQLAHL